MLRKTSRWSALSKPNHFIAESALHRFYRRNGNAVRSLAMLTAVLSAFGYLALREPLRPADPPAKDTRATAAQAEPARERVREAVDFRRALTTTDQAGDAFRDLPPLRMPEVAQAALPVTEPQPTAPTRAATGNPEPTVTSPPPAQRAAAPQPDTAPQQAIRESPPTPDTTAAINPSPPPAPEKPDIHAVVSQGDGALRRGEFEIARFHYREAMKAGDVLGAIGMAKSYDPLFLKSIGSDSKGSWPRAHAWYKRAAIMSGSPQARAAR